MTARTFVLLWPFADGHQGHRRGRVLPGRDPPLLVCKEARLEDTHLSRNFEVFGRHIVPAATLSILEEQVPFPDQMVEEVLAVAPEIRYLAIHRDVDHSMPDGEPIAPVFLQEDRLAAGAASAPSEPIPVLTLVAHRDRLPKLFLIFEEEEMNRIKQLIKEGVPPGLFPEGDVKIVLKGQRKCRPFPRVGEQEGPGKIVNGGGHGGLLSSPLGDFGPSAENVFG